MRSKNSCSERLARVIEQVSESVLGLSDNDVVAEVVAAGHDAQQESKRVHCVLQKPLQVVESVNLCLSNLGHSIDASKWQCGLLAYHNNCLLCGLAVSFTIATGEIGGAAVLRVCSAKGIQIRPTGTMS